MPENGILQFADLTSWEKWLEQNADSPGIWMKIAKKGAEEETIGYPEALEGALAFGWIDGQKKGLDDNHWLQRFTPRRPNGIWSKINTEKAEALIGAGRMRPAGLKEVERAKSDGRWQSAYRGQSTIEIPDDFAEALSTNAKASAFFEGLSKTKRYPFLFRIQNVKKPETRARKIADFVKMLEQGKSFHD